MRLCVLQPESVRAKPKKMCDYKLKLYISLITYATNIGRRALIYKHMEFRIQATCQRVIAIFPVILKHILISRKCAYQNMNRDRLHRLLNANMQKRRDAIDRPEPVLLSSIRLAQKEEINEETNREQTRT